MTDSNAAGSRAPDQGQAGEEWSPMLDRAIFDPQLSDQAFRTLAVALALDRRYRKGGVWETTPQIARKRAKGRSAVFAHLAELQELGYIGRESDREDQAPGRFIRFGFDLARGRPENRTPPVRNSGQSSGVHLMNGEPAPGNSDGCARNSGRTRPGNGGPAPGIPGASDRNSGHLLKREREKKNLDGDGRANGRGEPARPVAGEMKIPDPLTYTPDQVSALAPDFARVFVLADDQLAYWRSAAGEGEGPMISGIVRTARRILANHKAAEAVILWHITNGGLTSADGGKEETPPPRAPTKEAGGPVESHP